MRKVTLSILVTLALLLALTGCSTLKGEKSYITVTATSSIAVTPDAASFTITAEALEPTTEEARNASSKMISEAITILKDEFGITGDEIVTNYMNINPYYEWLDGGRTLTGQRATQSLNITIKNGLDKAGKVYDRLSVLDGISISSITYSKLDTTEDVEKAREEATKNALEKASDYARGLDMTVGKVVSLAEGSVSYSSYDFSNSKMMLAEAAAADSYSGTTYYAGDLSVSATVTAVFELR